MFRILYRLNGIDDFIRRIDGESSNDQGERDRVIAERNPDLLSVWYGGESFGRLWLESDGVLMEVSALGATVVLHQMTAAKSLLGGGDLAFRADSGGGYGVDLRFERSDESVTVSRIGGAGLKGPESFDLSWRDFTQGVEDFAVWYHTEYLAQASWLLRLDFVQEMRREAGYPLDHL